MGEGQQVEELDRLGPGAYLLEEGVANLLNLVETADRIDMR
jgi:hypothetical protein